MDKISLYLFLASGKPDRSLLFDTAIAEQQIWRKGHKPKRSLCCLQKLVKHYILRLVINGTRKMYGLETRTILGGIYEESWIFGVLYFAGCIAFKCFFIGCEKADDPLNPDDRTPTPGNTPTPFQSPTRNRPGSSMWGYINGSALVEVSGLEYNPYNEKESIFHLYHPTTQAWLNVRHRSGGKFQIKGALDSWYGCSDDVHYEYIQPGGNGVWRIEWEQHGDTTQVVVTSTARRFRNSAFKRRRRSMA